MKLLFKILFCSLIFCACANNNDESVRAVTPPTAEAKIQNHLDSLEQTISKSVDQVHEDLIDSKAANTTIQTEEKSSQIEEEIKPKTASTIAQQQEAARKIQNELENRNPKPIEEEVQQGAVFQKVVSTPKEKTEPNPTPVSTKKKAAPTKKPAKNKTYPAIEFEEMKMKFDTITEGDIIDHKFVFTNTGNAPLEIKSASASCGCTQPSFPFIPIEPNEQGHITVRYNSVSKEGFQNPEITIRTNINKKEIILFMEGFVAKKESKEEGK